jgi:hypothetical protein
MKPLQILDPDPGKPWLLAHVALHHKRALEKGKTTLNSF